MMTTASEAKEPSVKEKILQGAKAREQKVSRLSSQDPNFRATVLSYKYVSPPLSLLEYLYLDAFWEWVTVTFYPRWLAPNVITLVGFSFILFSCIIVLTYSPELTGDLLEPKFYLLFALCLFIYQTLDGSDGKQARRTKSGSALGELMDHGADALVTTLLPLTAADCFRLGSFSIYIWSIIILAQTCFYLSNLTLVHNGRQTFYNFDAMEVQTATQCMLITAGLMSPGFLSEGIIPVPEFLKSSNFAFRVVSQYFNVSQEDLRVLDFTSGYTSIRTVFIVGGVVGTSVNYFRLSISLLYPYISCKKKGGSLLNLAKHLGQIHMHVLISVVIYFQITSMEDEERAKEAIVAFGILSCVTFADFMNKILLFRVGGIPIGVFTENLILEISFIYCLYEDESMKEYFEANLNGTRWWNALAGVAVFNHLSYFARAVSVLAKVLEIHPFKVRQRAA